MSSSKVSAPLVSTSVSTSSPQKEEIPVGTAIQVSVEKKFHPQLRSYANMYVYKVKTKKGWRLHSISTPADLQLPKKTTINYVF